MIPEPPSAQFRAGRSRDRIRRGEVHSNLRGTLTMPKFIIEPHFRLHEWVAEDKGYFKTEGLDYEFRELVRTTAGQIHATPDRVGAFQSLEAGRKSNVSC